MKSQDLYKFIQRDMMPECLSIMTTKGESYSGLEDKLGNFKRCAKLAGVPIEKAWFIYFVKHYDALCAFIRMEYKDCESIRGRVIDMINYLFLFAAILKEQGRLDGKRKK